MKKLSAPQIVALSFLIAICCGTILLSFPQATRTGERLSLVDSLFTATSATCVTGLIVKDTGTFFSFFGQTVILILIQIGGLGIMTFSTLFTIMLGKKLTMIQSLRAKSALGYTKIEGLKELIKYIVLITLTAEAIGAAILFTRWNRLTNWSFGKTIFVSIFHAISAFCNAGFSTFTDSLMGWNADATIILTMSSLIILGGLGFIVILNLPRIMYFIPYFRRKQLQKQNNNINNNNFIKKIGLQAKIVLASTAVLIAIGFLVIFSIENKQALSGMPLADKILNTFFTAITPRTAGFNVLPTESLQTATKFFIMSLIFVGASPGSTGGGIKTVTLVVLLAGFFSMFKGRDRIFLFKRTIGRDVFRKSIAVFALAMLLIFISTFCLAITEKPTAKTSEYFLNLFFEVTSAFGTCGLSTGITPNLSGLGKIIITITMFLGRVGPLTAVLALTVRKEEKFYRLYPEEKIAVG